MFGECHEHIFMDGADYLAAVKTHKNGPCEPVIRAHLLEYQKRGVTYIRDGGDKYQASVLARKLAGEYGIVYRTPVFGIYKLGQYGKIVGFSFSNMKEYYSLVREAIGQKADFIKIMTTGLMDFDRHGQVTGTPLSLEEVREMVHIAHEEGMAVMSHTNGKQGAMTAIEAGVDSLEHGNFLDEETVKALSQSHTIWVPTTVTVRNLLGNGRFPDDTLRPIWETAAENIRTAYRLKAKVALGSDAGAYCVPHGQGIVDEYRTFQHILGDSEDVDLWLAAGETAVKETFQTHR